MVFEAIGGAMVKSAVSAGAGKIAAAVVEQGKRKLFPSDLEKAIQAGLETAHQEDEAASPGCSVFYRCQQQEQTRCLEGFVKHPTTVEELQKPWMENGKPDVDCLQAAFKQVGVDLRLNLVEDSVPRWVETFVATYFEQTAAAIRFQVAKARYLEQLAKRVNNVKFVGIAVPGEEVDKQEVLAQIFVMPDVREHKVNSSREAKLKILARNLYTGEVSETISGVVGEPMNWQLQLEIDQQAQVLSEQRLWATRDCLSSRISAQEVLTQSKKKAVLLGAPGSGKTTLASYFALMLCEQGQSDPTSIGFEVGEDWLPVVVQIREWISQPNLGLMDYLCQYAEKSLCAKALPQGFFEHWLDRGRALILLDGLDEVVDEVQRRKVAERIETFLHQYRDNPAVITSRPAGYRWDFLDLDEFPHYTLEPFDDNQVETFIDHWYNSRLKDDKAKADRRKADLQKAFGKSDRVKMLAKNPLLLTIIMWIHRYQAELPRRRHKLYENAVETLLMSWDSDKEIKLYEVLEYLKQDDLLYVLKKLAYWIHTQGSVGEEDGGTLIDKDELLKQLSKEIKELKSCKSHEAKEEAKRFVNFIQKRTGLLNEQGRDCYAFVHKTFQEYLTAEEIYDQANCEDNTDIILSHFRDRLHDQHWREVLLLLVSRLEGRKAEKAIEAVLNSGSDYEQWLHRDLLFAGWCLTEDPKKLKAVAPNLLGKILDRLVEIEISKPEDVGEKIKENAAKIFHCLGKTTVELDAWERLQAQAKHVDQFRLLNFQASLGQKDLVIEVLFDLLKSSNQTELFLATNFLFDLGDKSVEFKDRLLNSLPDHASNERAFVLYSFKQLSNPPNRIDNAITARKSSSLVKPDNHSPEAIEVFLRQLTSDDWAERIQAIALLGESRNISNKVINRLIESIGDSPIAVRQIIAISLNRLAKRSTEVLPILVQWINRQPEDQSIGGEIDALWSIVVE